MVKQSVWGARNLDTQAFSASGADVDGTQLAALDTLQHRLPGDAKRHGGFQHGQPAGRGVVDETGVQVVGDADAPGSARGDLFAGDEAVAQPAVHRGRGDAKDLGGFGHGDQLSFLRVGARLMAGDGPVGP
jgi:hypothetical protein